MRRGLEAPARRGTTIAISKRVKPRDLLMSAAAIAVLITLIALADDRVRDRVGGLSTQRVSYQVAHETSRFGSAAEKVRDLAVDNSALTLLVIASGVLFVFMLRT